MVHDDLPGLANVTHVENAVKRLKCLPAQWISDIFPGDPFTIRIANPGDHPVLFKKRQVVAQTWPLVDYVLFVDGDVKWSTRTHTSLPSIQETTYAQSVASPTLDIDANLAPDWVVSKSAIAIDGIKLADENPLEERLNFDPSIDEHRQLLLSTLRPFTEMWSRKLRHVNGFECRINLQPSDGLLCSAKTLVSYWSGHTRSLSYGDTRHGEKRCHITFTVRMVGTRSFYQKERRDPLVLCRLSPSQLYEVTG